MRAADLLAGLRHGLAVPALIAFHVRGIAHRGQLFGQHRGQRRARRAVLRHEPARDAIGRQRRLGGAGS